MAIDTSTFTSGTKTKKGAIRNPKQFWKAWKDNFPDGLSSDNVEQISNGRSPVIDNTWIKHFPEHDKFEGEKLIHHHLDHGKMAIPLPKSVHGTQPGWGIWHPEHAGKN